MSAPFTLTPTPPAALQPKAHMIGGLPETLNVLLGAMDIRRQFMRQAHTDSQEYWQCQRDLADLERRWAEAEALWAKHIGKERSR
jgi:hypothetical protein